MKSCSAWAATTPRPCPPRRFCSWQARASSQLETYFGAYLPQFFYAMIAPGHAVYCAGPVSLHAAVILMICVPLIPVSIVAVQKFAKKLLGKYWGRYAALGDSFLENLQGLTTLKIYQADGARHAAMNREAEHFRKVTMKVLTMQLNSIIVMDVIAYGGAALGIMTYVFRVFSPYECAACCALLIVSSIPEWLDSSATAPNASAL